MIVRSSSVMGRGRQRRRGPGSISGARVSWAKPHADPHMFNRTTLVILVVALAAGLGLLAAQKILSPPAAPGQPETRAISLFPQPRELPDFALQQSDGTRLLPGELH